MFLITPEKKGILDLTLTSSPATTPPSPSSSATATAVHAAAAVASSLPTKPNALFSGPKTKSNIISCQEVEEEQQQRGRHGRSCNEVAPLISETSRPISAGLLQYLIQSSAVLVNVFIDYFNPLKQWFTQSLRTLFTLLSALLWPKPGGELSVASLRLEHPLAWLQIRFDNQASGAHSSLKLEDTQSKLNYTPDSNRQSQASLWIGRANSLTPSILGGSRGLKSIRSSSSPESELKSPVATESCGPVTNYLNMDLYGRRWRSGATKSTASNSRPSTIDDACNWPHSSRDSMGEGQTSQRASPPAQPPLLMLGDSASSTLSFAGRVLPAQSHRPHQQEQPPTPPQQTWMQAQGHSNHFHRHSAYGALQIETNSGASEVNTEPPTLVQLPTHDQYNHQYQHHFHNISKSNYDSNFYDLFGRHNQQQQQQQQHNHHHYPTTHQQTAPAGNLARRHSFLSSTFLNSSDKQPSNFTSDVMQSFNSSLGRGHQLQAESIYQHRRRASMSISPSTSTSTASPLVLVSKDTLSDLTNKMKDLEEQVRVIPELQRRLDHVINDSNESSVQEFHHRANMSTGGFSINRNINSGASAGNQRLLHSHGALDEKMARKSSTSDLDSHPRGNSPLLQRQYTWIKSSSATSTNNTNKRDEPRSAMTNGSLSLQTTPVKHPTTPLDCGCQSFKEHLRYNSISRENRLNYISKYQSIRCTRNSNNNNISPQPTPTPTSSKVDASTNTDLSMEDVITREELNKLLEAERKSAQANISSYSHIYRYSRTKSSSIDSEQATTNSLNGQKSSSPLESQTDSCCDEEQPLKDQKQLEAFPKDLLEDLSNLQVGKTTNSLVSYNDEKPDATGKSDLTKEDNVITNQDDDDDDDDDEDRDSRTTSSNGEEPCSLGSSYQDPSDFEEYCAYGESLDRRTKDFISTSTKLPNDLKFALIRLNDLIKKKRSLNQVESTSSCLDIIRKAWFEVSTKKDSQSSRVKLYIDYIETMTKQLLNLVVNLIDSAGNTAMHYAASDCKLDIIKILLDTKVCDINCRNRAGYTPIMLLALAELKEPREQEIARQLFSLGDVNIMAQSSGQTALMLAASHGRVATCKLLLECGANPSLQDYDGSTALMCGSETGNEEVVRCLLDHKLTDLTATDNDGLDALTIAMNNGHKKIGLMLYAAKNVPRMTRSSFTRSGNTSGSYLGASLRRTRGKASNVVRRADSLLNRSRLSAFS